MNTNEQSQMDAYTDEGGEDTEFDLELLDNLV